MKLSVQPTFTWTLTGIGTIDSTGLYTAPMMIGTATVQAAAGGKIGTASVTVSTAQAPVARNDTYSVLQLQGHTVTAGDPTIQFSTLTVPASSGVLANDTGSPLKAFLVSGPTHGTLILNTDGSFSYIPNAGFVGTDSFVYAASNGAQSSNGTVTINVTAPPAGVSLDARGILIVEGTAWNDSVVIQTFMLDVPSAAVSFVSKDNLGNIVFQQTFSVPISKVNYVVFHGNAGNDSFTLYSALPLSAWGGDGDDYIQGSTGNDYLYGEAGNDTLLGEAGADYIDGGAGTNLLYGGAGIDVIVPGFPGQNYIFPDG